MRAADPHVDDAHVPAEPRGSEATTDEVVAADLVVVLVDHDRWDLPALCANASHVLDCRHVVGGSNVEYL